LKGGVLFIGEWSSWDMCKYWNKVCL